MEIVGDFLRKLKNKLKTYVISQRKGRLGN